MDSKKEANATAEELICAKARAYDLIALFEQVSNKLQEQNRLISSLQKLLPTSTDIKHD